MRIATRVALTCCVLLLFLEMPSSAASKIMLFGGYNHETYLGCVSCSEYASDSIFNEVGRHGSRVSSDSIWNSVSQYGSSVSNYSACNELANDPPVIVDADGNFYGRMTINTLHRQLGAGEKFVGWLKSTVCEH